MSEVGIPGANEAVNEVPQVLGRADTGATQTFAAQDREPDLHLVEPRAMSGQPVESDLGALGGAPVQDGLFLMITGVVHNQMPAPVRVAGAQRSQEVAELQVGMARIALREDLPGAHLKSGKKIDGPMAEILKLLTFDQPWPQGQGRVQALQGLNVGLLIETQDPTAPGRMQIEVDNLCHLLLKQGIGPSQEVAQAVGLEDQLGQNPLDSRRTHGQNLSAPGDQPRQIPPAGMRPPPQTPAPQRLGRRRRRPCAAPAGEKAGGRPDRDKSCRAAKRATGSASSSTIRGGGSYSAKRLRHFCTKLREVPTRSAIA